MKRTLLQKEVDRAFAGGVIAAWSLLGFLRVLTLVKEWSWSATILLLATGLATFFGVSDWVKARKVG